MESSAMWVEALEMFEPELANTIDGGIDIGYFGGIYWY